MGNIEKGIAKGAFSPSLSFDSHIDAGIDTYREYIDFNCTIHTKCQHQHQH